MTESLFSFENLDTSIINLDTSNFESCGDGTNWYIYANNNPLRFIDPTGLATVNGEYVPDAAIKSGDITVQRGDYVDMDNGTYKSRGRSTYDRHKDGSINNDDPSTWGDTGNDSDIISGTKPSYLAIQNDARDHVQAMNKEHDIIMNSTLASGGVQPSGDEMGLMMGAYSLYNNAVASFLGGTSMAILDNAKNGQVDPSKVMKGTILGNFSATLANMSTIPSLSSLLKTSLIGGSSSVAATGILDNGLSTKSAATSFSSGLLLSGFLYGANQLPKVSSIIPGLKYSSVSSTTINNQYIPGRVITNSSFNKYNFMVGQISGPVISTFEGTQN